MAASLQGIEKGSLVHRFITSGKKGKCELCPSIVEKLEAHHLCYSPEKTIKLCHNCHHKVHFWPNRLTEFEKLKLLTKRFDVITANSLIKKNITSPVSLAKLIAPSRNAFIHAAQRIEQKRAKSSHSPEVQKVNKEVTLKNRMKPAQHLKSQSSDV